MTESLKSSTLIVPRRLSIVEDHQSTNSNEINDQRKRSTHLAPPNGINLQPIVAVNAPDRKQSMWNAAARKSIFSRRFSQALSQSSRKSSQDQIRYQNTYKLNPDDDSKFYAYRIEPKVRDILEDSLKNRKYDATKCVQLSKELSENILRETRNCLHQPRYKLVAHVLIGQYNGQDIRCASRCLWDPNFDDYVTVVAKVNDIYAVATLFAMYYD